MRPYTPKLGSTVEQSLAHLATLAPGAEITHMKLAERVGVAPSTMKLTLEAAVKHGCIVARDGAEGSKIVWYSLPTGQQHSNGADAPPSAPSEAAPARPPAKGTATPKDGGSPPRKTLRVSLWSDGVLQIEHHAAGVVAFTREETRQIVSYLRAISLEPVEGQG